MNALRPIWMWYAARDLAGDKQKDVAGVLGTLVPICIACATDKDVERASTANGTSHERTPRDLGTCRKT